MWTVCVGIYGTLGRRWNDGRSFAGVHEMKSHFHMCTYVHIHLALPNYVIFLQKLVDDNREQTVAEIIMSKKNLDEKAKKDVLDIAAKACA